MGVLKSGTHSHNTESMFKETEDERMVFLEDNFKEKFLIESSIEK